MTKYLLNVETKKAYAFSEDGGVAVNEIRDAGIEIKNQNHLDTVGMGCEPISLPGYIRVSSKLYDKYGVKTSFVKKTKKTISAKDLAAMSEEEILEFARNAKAAA